MPTHHQTSRLSRISCDSQPENNELSYTPHLRFLYPPSIVWIIVEARELTLTVVIQHRQRWPPPRYTPLGYLELLLIYALLHSTKVYPCPYPFQSPLMNLSHSVRNTSQQTYHKCSGENIITICYPTGFTSIL